MMTEGERGKNCPNFDDVICERPLIPFYHFLMVSFDPSKLADMLPGIKNLLNRLTIAIINYPYHVTRVRY